MLRMLVALVLSFLASTALGATVYKWVDAQGATHYTDAPPPGQKAREIHAEPPSPATDGAQPAPKTWQEEEREFLRRRVDRKEAERQEEERAAAAKREAADRKKRCIVATQNLQTLQQGRPVYRLNEQGERQYLDDSMRAAEIERFKKEVETYCRPQPE